MFMKVSVYVKVNNRPKSIYSENVQVSGDKSLKDLGSLKDDIAGEFLEKNPHFKGLICEVRGVVTMW